MNKIIFLFSILALTVSCGGSNDSNNETVTTPEQISKQEKQETEIEKRIADTDLQDKLDVMNSLYFTKEDGSSLEVKDFLDKSGNILKVEEKYVDKEKDSYGTNLFYIRNGKKYASKERFEEKDGKNAFFVERVTFYDDKEQVATTKIRKADFEENLDAVPLEITKSVDCSIKRAMDALNQEGDFETRFQGFVNSNNTNYIVVGPSGSDQYNSALMLQYNSTTTNNLMRNQEASIGKKLDLEFQKMVDDNGFEFQVLLTLKVVK